MKKISMNIYNNIQQLLFFNFFEKNILYLKKTKSNNKNIYLYVGEILKKNQIICTYQI